MLIDDKLEKIIDYFKNDLNIGTKDYMLVGEWAFLYNGFAAEKHNNIRIAIRGEAIPWKVNYDLETYPNPKEYDFFMQKYCDMIKNGISLSQIPLPQGNWGIKTLSRSKLYKLENGAEIQICEPIVEIESYRHLVHKFGPELFYDNSQKSYPKFQKWIQHIDEVAKAVKEKDFETCRKIRELLVSFI